jgi:hypothetical protein
MKKAVRAVVLLGVALVIACDASRAQPAQAAPGHEARCREAASRYVHPSPNKEHLTEEAEADYEYRQQKMYLRLCGDSDDALTRHVKESVGGYESYRTLARLIPAARKAGSPESKDPNTYAAIAAAYEVRRALLFKYKPNYANASEADKIFNEEIDRQTDLLIDAYARAVAVCGLRADCRQQKDAWTQKLKAGYRSRHGDSEAGLEELIRSVLDGPLPQP